MTPTDHAGPGRLEHDTLGPVRVPVDRLWGAQTQRALENFRISTEKMPLELIRALARVKRAVARANVDLGVLDGRIGEAIVAAADEVAAGRHDREFPLPVWQTGSGTQTHMNVNEVLANRASEILGGERGDGRLVHPNDHVNRGQSTNDVFPTAMHLAVVTALNEDVIPAARRLRDTLDEKARAWQDLVKIGRTHLQDATPLTLGQEISGWVAQLEHGIAHLEDALPHLHELALGGTAVGTGLNAYPEVAERATRVLREETGYPFACAPNRFEAIAARDGIVHAHGALKTLAASLNKIANDVRWLASGPRSGLGEITLPANEPGSSIMPGKVNPTQAEALTMAVARVMGNDVTVNVAGMSGSFELNAFMPVIADVALQSCRLLADGCASFRDHCAACLEPVPERIRENVERSLMLVTALAPHVGYDAAARVAKTAHETGQTLRKTAVDLGVVTPEQYDEWVRPEEMAGRAGA
jgi:fumarate hydratase class II